MTSCAGEIEIRSNPSNAEVFSLQGESLGKTPLKLSGVQKEKILDNDLVSFKVTESGYLPRIVFLDSRATRRIEVSLPRADLQTFKNEFSIDFAAEQNQMVRSTFSIQRLLLEKKYPELHKELEAFKSRYPHMAFPYLIEASASIANRKNNDAKIHLLRARALDPKDPNIDRMLRLLKGQEDLSSGVKR